MNTFSFEVKQEILKKRYDASCCAISSLCAVIETLGEIVFRNGKMTVSLTIDHDDMFEFVVETIEKFYGKIDEESEIHVTKRVGNDRREWILSPQLGERLLFDTGIVSFENGTMKINRHIERNLVMEDCCKIAYLSHAFAGSGTVSLPSEGSGGYHMEWSSSNEEMCSDIAQLLTEFGVLPKIVRRNDKFVVYIKDRETISDLLARFGAVKSMLRMAEAQAERDLRNRINRGANCMTANISKTVDASAKQLSAIAVIEQTIGLDGLSDALKEMALARKNDPSASLSALAEKLGISKSAVRARLDNLMALAESLEQ